MGEDSRLTAVARPADQLADVVAGPADRHLAHTPESCNSGSSSGTPPSRRRWHEVRPSWQSVVGSPLVDHVRQWIRSALLAPSTTCYASSPAVACDSAQTGAVYSLQRDGSRISRRSAALPCGLLPVPPRAQASGRPCWRDRLRRPLHQGLQATAIHRPSKSALLLGSIEYFIDCRDACGVANAPGPKLSGLQPYSRQTIEYMI